MRQLLARRDMRLLLLGETASMFGDRAMLLVFAMWVKVLTGSNAAAGLTLFAVNLPALAGPVGGLVVDRLRRRQVMIAVDCLIGASVLTLVFVHGREQVWLIFAVAVLYGTALTVFAPAQSALLTVMLPPELLGQANGAFQTVREGLRLVAPLVGAGIFAAVGGASVAVLDAATFAISAGCLGALRVREPQPSPLEHGVLRELASGARHILRTLPIRQMVVAVALSLLVIGFNETLVFAVIDQGLHRSPSFLGIISSAQGIGAVVGGILAARALGRLGDLRLAGVGAALFAAGNAFIVLPFVAAVLIGMAIAGAGLSWMLVGFTTALQLRTPANLQGRTYAAADTMVTVPQTVSIAIGAALSTIFDYRLLLGVVSVVVAGAGLYLASRRRTSAGRPGSYSPER